jgi:hypothetical protein
VKNFVFKVKKAAMILRLRRNEKNEEENENCREDGSRFKVVKMQRNVKIVISEQVPERSVKNEAISKIKD